MVKKLPSPPKPGLALQNFIKEHNADIYCFQETKLSEDQLDPSLRFIEGYESFWSFSKVKKGYSGVVTYAKTGITVNAKAGFGIPKFDDEGRIMMTDHHSFILYNIYFPNAGMGPERLRYKMEFYEAFLEKILELRKEGRHVVIVGDVNTAFEDIDIWNPQYHNVDALFPQERKWMRRWYDSGFVDTLRHLYPNENGHYSWFDPLYPDYRRTNKGWRLDYTVCDSEFCKSDLVDAGVLSDVGRLSNLSDHCPVYIKLKPQPPVPPHPTPALSSIHAQMKQPNIKAFFKPKADVETQEKGQEEVVNSVIHPANHSAAEITKNSNDNVHFNEDVNHLNNTFDRKETQSDGQNEKNTLFAFGVKRRSPITQNLNPSKNNNTCKKRKKR